MDAVICIGALVIATILGISIAIHNVNDTERIEANLKARREYRRLRKEKRGW